MPSRKLTLIPLQLSINSSETLTLKLIFKLSQISTRQQISRQELNNISLKNSLGIISGKLEFGLTNEIDLKDYKINFDIINLKGKDVRFVGNGQWELWNWENAKQLFVQRCWDKQAKLKVVMEIQEFVVRQPLNKVMNLTYEIGRKDQVINTLLKKKVEQIWRTSKGGQVTRQISGSYKKRFQYQNSKLSKRSPSPRMKTPQPIRKTQTPSISKLLNNQNKTNESRISHEPKRFLRQQKQSSKRDSPFSKEVNYQRLTQKLQWIENQLKGKDKNSVRTDSNANLEQLQSKDYGESNEVDIQRLLPSQYIIQGASSPIQINSGQLQCKKSNLSQTIGEEIKNQNNQAMDNGNENGQCAGDFIELEVGNLLITSDRQVFKEVIGMPQESNQNQQVLLTQIQTLKQSLQSLKLTNSQLQVQLRQATSDYKIKIQALSNDYNRELTEKGQEIAKLTQQLQSRRELSKQMEQQAERNRNLIQKLTRLYEGDQEKEKKWEEVLGKLQKRLREVNYENQDLKEHRKQTQGRSKQPHSTDRNPNFIHSNNQSKETYNGLLLGLKSKCINLESHVKTKEHQLSYMRLKMDSLKQQNTDLRQVISNLDRNNYTKYYNQPQNSSSPGLNKLQRSINCQLQNLKGENGILREKVQTLKEQIQRLNQTFCQFSTLKCRNVFDFGKENVTLDQKADVSQDLLKKKKVRFEELLNIGPKRQNQKPNSATNR